MKVAILAGGRGTRLGSTKRRLPKPMYEIGDRPLLWHLLKYYVAFGFEEFVIAAGYRGECISDYFRIHGDSTGATQINVVDTGLDTATGGRVKRLRDFVGDDTFMLTWGDGLADVNLHELAAFHRGHGRLATVTAVQPPLKFGRLEMVNDRVVRFEEKPRQHGIWINGAFFVLEPEVFDYIEGDETSWERGPMERFAEDEQLMAYKHHGFWQCMDTTAEWELLQRIWVNGAAPWDVSLAEKSSRNSEVVL